MSLEYLEKELEKEIENSNPYADVENTKFLLELQETMKFVKRLKSFLKENNAKIVSRKTGKPFTTEDIFIY